MLNKNLVKLVNIEDHQALTLKVLVEKELHYETGFKKKTGDKLTTLQKNVEKNEKTIINTTTINF